VATQRSPATVCEDGQVTASTTSNFLATWPTIAIVLGGVALLALGALVGVLVGRRRGQRAIAQRLTALGTRLGIEQPNDDGRVETALNFLEEVTGAATTAVTESSADAIRLRRSLDTLPLGLVLCDEAGTVIYRNTQAEGLMTNRYGDALAAQAVTELLDEGWRNGVAERTIDLYGPPRRTITIRAQVIDDGRRPLGVLALIEDVSERRRLEEIRRDFIANVSHELKTPMGALGLLAETLQYEKDEAVAQRLAERIHTEAFRVNRIIEDLLDLSRLESEGAPVREPVPVALFVAEAIERIRTAAEQRDNKIVFNEPPVNLRVTGDRRQLVSAVHALLENAAAYSPEGTPIEIDVERIEKSGETELMDGPYARIEVRDHGIGIPAKDLERIFERFYRVDPGRARQTGGTGLGLSIVRHVAQNHGGAVSVSSREGDGSRFCLDLPLSTT
jgi:two-component system sensor histidine kinase SenX3